MQAPTGPVPALPAGPVDEAAARMLDTLVRALPRVAFAVALLLLAWLLARLLRMALRRVLRGHRSPSFVNVMATLAGWVIVTLGVLAAVTVVFPSVRPVDLLGGLGFFSIAVGFAFQDILENTLSGVLMLFRQPFRSGDQIEVQGQSGTVQAISIRETRIRTFDGQLVLIPNRDVYKSVIRVQTHYEHRRQAFTVGIAYENDAREASRVVVAALAGVPGVLADPAPEALVRTLGVSTVDVEARFWTVPQQHEGLLALDAAIVAVKAALEAAGIEMPADIVALQATPSFRAALQGDADVTPGGSVRPRDALG